LITDKFKAQVRLLLLGLVILDVILSGLCLFFPQTWFRIFHNAPYIDPQALLRRTGAVWAAFTLFQLVALIRWQKQPYWLVLVAGIRLTEVFSDWVYLALCGSITWFGRIALFISPPGNVAFAWILIRLWKRIGEGREM